jgi:hypothetical protein
MLKSAVRRLAVSAAASAVIMLLGVYGGGSLTPLDVQYPIARFLLLTVVIFALWSVARREPDHHEDEQTKRYGL